MEGFEGADGCRMPVEANAELGAWEGLADTLRPLPAGEMIVQPAGEPIEGESKPSAQPEAPGPVTVPVDPGELATLVGEEVASVLKAAQVAAAEIRSKAEDVAAETQRRISEMQNALVQMSAEMSDFMTRTAERVPFAPRAERTAGSATPVDEPIVIERRSATAPPTSDFRPNVGDRPGDYQRMLQRMGELSSQEPR